MTESEMTAPTASFSRTVWDFVTISLTASLRQKSFWILLSLATTCLLIGIASDSPELVGSGAAVVLVVPISPVVVAIYRLRVNPRLKGPFSQTFEDTEILMRSPVGDAQLKWDAFERVVRIGSEYFMYLGRQPVNIVPARAFSSPLDEARFQELCRRHAKTNF